MAVHRDAAVDVSGNSTFGTVATLALLVGNWSITATATIQDTAPSIESSASSLPATSFTRDGPCLEPTVQDLWVPWCCC